MNLLDQLAEAKIREAQIDGQFDDLPGAGEPLALDCNDMVEPSLRVAYRILKNSGFVPPEVAARQQIEHIELLLQNISDPARRKPLIAQLLHKLSRLPDRNLRADSRADYYHRLLDRLSGVDT